jgi:hypothetical protein
MVRVLVSVVGLLLWPEPKEGEDHGRREYEGV